MARLKKIKSALAGSLLSLGVAASGYAEVQAPGGHLKYQANVSRYRQDDLPSFYGARAPFDHALDLRVKTAWRESPWDLQLHYELLGIYGDTPRLLDKLPETGGAPDFYRVADDRRRLLRLTGEVGGDGPLQAVHRLDRLALGYSGERLVLRLGRQAVTWGNGLAFHPLDIFSPFAPTAVDKDYKSGDDMLYGQWLFADGSDVQAILLPRRVPQSGTVESAQSSLAFKYHGRSAANWDFDLVAARHYAENVIGLGFSKDVAGAIWRTDAGLARLQDGKSAVSVVANLDYSWMWGGKNIYGYLEYFHHSLGETAPSAYSAPAVALRERLARNEIFTLGRDYASGGMQIEWLPLVNFHTSLLANLRDGSGVFQIRGTYDWREDLQFSAGLELPYGGRGSEFGGIPLPGGAGYAAPGRRLYLRLAYYF